MIAWRVREIGGGVGGFHASPRQDAWLSRCDAAHVVADTTPPVGPRANWVARGLMVSSELDECLPPARASP